MSYSTIQEDGVTRICANVTFSNNETMYVEVPVTSETTESDYEQILSDQALMLFKEWDSEGNEIALDFTVTSVTQPE